MSNEGTSKGPRPFCYAPAKDKNSKYISLDSSNLSDTASCSSSSSSSTNISSSFASSTTNDSSRQLYPTECYCGNCGPMAKAKEAVCCVTSDAKNAQFKNFVLSAGHCVLESEEIKTSIGEVNCRLQWYTQRRLALFTEEECRFELMQNNNYRHHAYRSYISYINGLLGKGVRKVIPSCVVTEIRRRWPDPNGLYRGHISVNELDEVFD